MAWQADDQAASEWGTSDSAWGADAGGDASDFTETSYSGGGGGGGGDRACHACGEEGHFSRECPTKANRSRACHNCGEEGHMSRDCPTKESRIITCRRCNEEGHMSRDCPNPSSVVCHKCNETGHMSRECPSATPRTCRKCNEEGHQARDCPTGEPDKCFSCQQEGHMSKDCPDRKPMKCHNCGEEGHRISECTQEKKPRTDENGNLLPAPVSYIPSVEDVTDAKFDMLYYAEANIGRFDTMAVTVSDPQFEVPITSFEEAQLSENLLVTLKSRLKYNLPTPIQKFCIPIIMAGRDVIACSQTGSGKSAAFILPIVQNLMNDPELPQRDEIRGKRTQCPLVVVLSPTRELCLQLYEHFRLFSEENPRRIGVSPAYGGTQVRYNAEQIRSGTHVLCAVPGRLKQFLGDGTISFSKVRYLVLDEADRMLDEGFSEAIQEICSHESMVPKENRQTLMFSATFSTVEQLAREMMKPDTVKVVVGILGGVNSDIEQRFIRCADLKEKREALKAILEEHLPGSKVGDADQLENGVAGKAMVFVEKKGTADIIGVFLIQSGFSATTMHGARDQQQREEALQTFRTGKHAVLVATEVAARGLDIKGLGMVINFDMPKDIDKFVHRVGRTGRVGTRGVAISLFEESRDSALAPYLVKVLNECGQPVPDFISNAASGGFNDDFGAADGDGGDFGEGFGDGDGGWGT